jgi:hypothetical protein
MKRQARLRQRESSVIASRPGGRRISTGGATTGPGSYAASRSSRSPVKIRPLRGLPCRGVYEHINSSAAVGAFGGLGHHMNKPNHVSVRPHSQLSHACKARGELCGRRRRFSDSDLGREVLLKLLCARSTHPLCEGAALRPRRGRTLLRRRVPGGKNHHRSKRSESGKTREGRH